MENKESLTIKKKCVNKARSCTYGSAERSRIGPSRGILSNKNGTVKSLELELNKFTKGNTENSSISNSLIKNGVTTNIANNLTPKNMRCSFDNVSQASTNLSRYELLRNLSRTMCNSDCGCSCNTSNTCENTTDVLAKDENLERFFQSVEMWSKNGDYGDQSNAIQSDNVSND